MPISENKKLIFKKINPISLKYIKNQKINI
jgi:hypothetical protein